MSIVHVPGYVKADGTRVGSYTYTRGESLGTRDVGNDLVHAGDAVQVVGVHGRAGQAHPYYGRRGTATGIRGGRIRVRIHPGEHGGQFDLNLKPGNVGRTRDEATFPNSQERAMGIASSTTGRQVHERLHPTRRWRDASVTERNNANAEAAELNAELAQPVQPNAVETRQRDESLAAEQTRRRESAPAHTADELRARLGAQTNQATAGATSPARSPAGRIRNLRAMSDEKLQRLVTEMEGSNDAEALNAVNDMAVTRELRPTESRRLEIENTRQTAVRPGIEDFNALMGGGAEGQAAMEAGFSARREAQREIHNAEVERGQATRPAPSGQNWIAARGRSARAYNRSLGGL